VPLFNIIMVSTLLPPVFHEAKPRKYSYVDILKMEQLFSSYEEESQLSEMNELSERACKAHLGDSMTVNLTSAMQIFNMKQHYGKLLVFDLRPRLDYHKAHLKNSLSFPIDLCKEEFFINWDPTRVEREIIKNKEKLNLFRNRKRLFVVIIPSQEDI